MKLQYHKPEKYKGGILFRIVLVLTMLFLLLSIYYCIRYLSGSGMNGLHSVPENFTFMTSDKTKFGMMSLAIVIIEMAVIFYFLFSLNRFFSRSSERTVRITGIILWAVMIAFQLYVIFSIGSAPTGDAFRVLNRSYAIASGEIQPGHYDLPSFKRFSNNDFSLLVMTAFFRIMIALGVGKAAIYKILIILNTACVDLGILFAALTVGLKGGRKAEVSLVSVAALNPLYYLIIFWVYTNTASMLPMMLIVYLLALYEKNRSGYSAVKQLVFMICTGLVAAIAYSVRATAFFPVIAYFIWRFILFIRKESDRRHVISTAILIVSSAVFISGISHISAPLNPDKAGNYPLIHWVKIGTTGTGAIDAHQLAALDSIEGKDAKARSEESAMKNEINKRGLHGNLIFFMHKTGLTWSKAESDYQARIVPFANSEKTLGSFLLGNRRYMTTLYLYSYRFLLLLLGIIGGIYLFIRKADAGVATTVYSLFGGYLFYTFWEGKPSYSFPFLIFIAMMALPVFTSAKSEGSSESGRNSAVGILTDVRLAIAVCVICIIGQAAVQEHFIGNRQKPYQRSIYAVTDNKVRNTIDEGSSLTQEFSPRYGFNHMTLLVSNMDKENISDYSFRITNGSDVIVSDPEVTVKGESIDLSFKELRPQKNHPYILEIMNNGGDDRALWLTQYTRSFDMYSGDTVVNGNRVDGKMEMIVEKI